MNTAPNEWVYPYRKHTQPALHVRGKQLVQYDTLAAKLGASAVIVWRYLVAERSPYTGIVKTDYRTIAADTGLAERRIEKALARLREAGLVADRKLEMNLHTGKWVRVRFISGSPPGELSPDSTRCYVSNQTAVWSLSSFQHGGKRPGAGRPKGVRVANESGKVVTKKSRKSSGGPKTKKAKETKPLAAVLAKDSRGVVRAKKERLETPQKPVKCSGKTEENILEAIKESRGGVYQESSFFKKEDSISICPFAPKSENLYAAEPRISGAPRPIFIDFERSGEEQTLAGSAQSNPEKLVPDVPTSCERHIIDGKLFGIGVFGDDGTVHFGGSPGDGRAIHPAAMSHSCPGVPDRVIVMRIANCQIPNPPLLNPDDSPERHAQLLANWYTDAVEKITKQRCFTFHKTSAVKSKFLPLLLRAASDFIEHEIEPAAWIGYMIDSWVEEHGKDVAPPITFVLGTKNIGARKAGFFRCAIDYSGGRQIYVPPARELMELQEGMRNTFRRENPAMGAETEALVARFFPGNYFEELCERAKKEAAEKRLEIRTAAFNGRWVWE